MYECNRPQNAGMNGRNEATLRYEVSSIQKSTHSEKDVLDLFRRMYEPALGRKPMSVGSEPQFSKVGQ